MLHKQVVCGVAWGVLVGWVLGSAGCGPARLNQSKEYTMDVGEARALDLQPQRQAQKLTVEYVVSNGEARVLVFRAEDAPGDQGLLDTPASKALASHRGSKGDFTVDVPANTAVRVVVRDLTRQATVTLKVTNR